jgi:hypothetical protein
MKGLNRFWRVTEVVLYGICIFVLSGAVSEATAERNSLTFINKSGEKALVKLVGPTRGLVEVPDAGEATVKIAGGTYTIYVRYGKEPKYRYSRGEVFKISDSDVSYAKATLTLQRFQTGTIRPIVARRPNSITSKYSL